jgi:GT2 family glycosyltransferase
MKLSVLIVNWNTQELLRNCLRSVFASDFVHPYEVIVVDNASTDGSPEMVERGFPSVTLLKNDVNAGFAKANNQAIEISRGEHVLLLNSDTEVAPETFSILLAAAEQNPNAGVLGCQLLNRDGSLQGSCSRFPTFVSQTTYAFQRRLNKAFGRPRRFKPVWDGSAVGEVEVVKGAFFWIRREVLDQIGQLDERFFFYGEEVDFCFRARQAGWKVMMVPGTTVSHFDGKSAAKIPAVSLGRRTAAMALFFRKHHGRAYAGLYRCAIILFAFFGLLRGHNAYAWDVFRMKFYAAVTGRFPGSI